MRLLVLLLSTFFLIQGCAPDPFKDIPAGTAYFSYLKYSGNDAWYTRHPKANDEFYNPILPGFFPDPSVCNKGNDYYLVTSTFSFFPGIPIFHSNDLVNWKQIGHVLDRPSQLNVIDQPVSHGIFAPAINYNPHNDTFYLTTTFVNGGGNFVVKAKDPAGPWSDPIWIPEVEGIDPSLFFDDDGRAYMVNNGDPIGKPLYQGHKAVWFQEYDVKNDKMIGPRTVIRNAGHNIAEKPIWIEGPHIYKIDGFYYLMTAEGGTSINHSQVIFRSKKVNGPYETYADNPILTQRDQPADREFPVTNAGHADLLRLENGDWYAVFLACRPYNEQNMFNIGREVFLLPVSWKNGWPMILEPGKLIPPVLKVPYGYKPVEEGQGYMQNGNFTWEDRFAGPELGMEYFFLRTPKEKWYRFDEKRGGLLIDARQTNLRERGQPSVIFRRQQHHEMTVETELYFVPIDSGSFAGITLFQNDAFHYSMGITLRDGKQGLVLQKAELKNEKSEKIVMAETVLCEKFKGQIKLKVECKDKAYAFYYSLGKDEWICLKDKVDIEYLSTEKAQGFIGTVVGLYASANE
jgi:xylan 1,4-beta-xylosidase